MKITAFKPLLSAIFLSLLPVTQSGAATVSIMIVETGRDTQADGGASGIWEGGMMDVFFDSGHIVSNAPALRTLPDYDEALEDEVRRSLEEASRNGADYFVVARLDYSSAEAKGTQKPERVSLKLYKIQPYAVLYDKNLDADFLTYETLSNAKKAAMILAPYLRGGS
jgi:hypothetical protein